MNDRNGTNVEFQLADAETVRVMQAVTSGPLEPHRASAALADETARERGR